MKWRWRAYIQAGIDETIIYQRLYKIQKDQSTMIFLICDLKTWHFSFHEFHYIDANTLLVVTKRFLLQRKHE